LSASALEPKMGMRGSATCVMNDDVATGFLVGKPYRGLAAMFTMMNYERLSIGIQALDLITRKILRDGGETVRTFIAELQTTEVPSEFR